MFGVMDCNNFFVSCERVFDPSLEGKPVVVLSSNDGCIVSRSQEAKDLGITMGLPEFKMREFLLTRYGSNHPAVEKRSSNFFLYGDMSRRIMSLLAYYAGDIEVYSIDEAFMNFNGMDCYAAEEKAREIVRKIKKNTGVPVCIGIAPTKTLAKAANKFAKKYAGYGNVCMIETEEKRLKAMERLPVGDVWGIGRRSAELLMGEGISTAAGLLRRTPFWVKKKLTVTGLRTYMELLGQPVSDLEVSGEKKSICVSRSFDKMITAKEGLEEAVSTFASDCSGKLRRQKSVASSVTVFIFTNKHRKDLPQYYNSGTYVFEEASDDTLEIVSVSEKILDGIFRDGYSYKKAGVILNDVCDGSYVQQNIFSRRPAEKLRTVNAVMDDINVRYGRNSLHVASSGNRNWKIKKDTLSGCYTTDINDIIIVHAD
ncbi:MAG: Y-family DNA polymerase [Bacteroidales bacterium]|jgi:DNA polymerase V|nr:Y-family DNA polymerase [Bacteroidales bacterium]